MASILGDLDLARGWAENLEPADEVADEVRELVDRLRELHHRGRPGRVDAFEPASFLVISDRKAFDGIFGVAFVMGDTSHRLPEKAFDSKMVVAVIKRGKALWQFAVHGVQAMEGVLAVRYTETATQQDSAEYACPLIVSIDKANYRAIRFEENGKVVKEIPHMPGACTAMAFPDPVALPYERILNAR